MVRWSVCFDSHLHSLYISEIFISKSLHVLFEFFLHKKTYRYSPCVEINKIYMCQVQVETIKASSPLKIRMHVLLSG